VTQVGRRLDLAQEALVTQRRRQLRPQHLHRHPPLVLYVGGEVDGGHPRGAELALDAVAVRECGRESGQDLSHRPPMIDGQDRTENGV
jgi:hypothetical protein